MCRQQKTHTVRKDDENITVLSNYLDHLTDQKGWQTLESNNTEDQEKKERNSLKDLRNFLIPRLKKVIS